MFGISDELKTKAQEVADYMEKENLDVFVLEIHTFKGVLVKDKSLELQNRIKNKSFILGPCFSNSGNKYWISLN